MVPKNKGLKRINHNILRDFSFPQNFGSSALPGLPPGGLGRKPLAIKNQFISQFCTAFATSSSSEYQELVILSPEYQTAKVGQETGTPILNGADPKTAMKAAIDYGSLEASKTPLTFEQNGWTIPADWNNYPSTLDITASLHKKKAFYRVAHGFPQDYDSFDNIRLALWQGRDQNAVVMAFGFWYDEWNKVGSNGIVVTPSTAPITRHAYLYIDFKEINGVEYIVAQLSQGSGFGDGGLLYFDRQTINKVWGGFWSQLFNGIGMYAFADLVDDVKPVGLAALIPTSKPSLLLQFCIGQRDFEGQPGDHNYRLNNPGNLKKADGSFFVYKTMDEGMAALKDYVTRVAKGLHHAYPKGGETNIMEYCHTFTGDPEPSPTNYAIFLGKRINADPNTFKMKNLLT